MNQASNPSETQNAPTDVQPMIDQPANPSAEDAMHPTPPPSYVKLAMRNMVRKGGKSLFHFTLTTVGLVGLLVALAYLTR